jgi:hypothetical protein
LALESTPSFYPYLFAGLEHEHVFTPSRGRSAVIALELEGFVVDTVEQVRSVFRDETSPYNPLHHQSCPAQFRELCRLSVAKNKPIYASKQRQEEAEWRVPIADIWEANEPGSNAR